MNHDAAHDDPATTAPFAARHIGPRGDDVEAMLAAIGRESIEALVDEAVPASIRLEGELALRPPLTEAETLAELREIAGQNVEAVQMIGQGYSDTITPPVLRRNILENPAWYTAYTPYQPEISQGRLEALLNFQTMVASLAGLEIANASLLDEASAVAEAVLLMRRANKGAKDGAVVLDRGLHPQSLALVTARAKAVDLPVRIVDLAADGLPEGELVGVVLQQPTTLGVVRDDRELIAEAKRRGALVTIAADLLALCLIASPGEQGADIAVGSAQRFGVPLFFGGPHAAFMAVRKGLERTLPGRLVGVSADSAGRPAYRLALQTREQHIRREKATSNICTAQALLAVVAGMYAAYHGPDGLRAIAERVHLQARRLAASLAEAGLRIDDAPIFDAFVVTAPGRAEELLAAAAREGINLRRIDADRVGIACDEVTTETILERLARALGASLIAADDLGDRFAIPSRRADAILEHEVFSAHRSETRMMRYLRRLADRDLALDRTMIPLGSCTMKLNAAVEMEAISWPELAGIHPFAPESQTVGWRRLIRELEADLAEVTGYDAVSIQPNAGSQGELAGLIAIRSYLDSIGEGQRRTCLIPASAHGTNAASAVLAGLSVVVVATAKDGSIDLDDLRAKLAEHASDLAAIMITYPSTHGVYEETVTQVCRLVHEAGGQVYVDGANLNALLGLAKPGEFGGDVSHLNLHKTFCIPHGGGGPGVGPVAVRAHLADFLPGNAAEGETSLARPPISASQFGSAGVLPISWAYIRLMGAEGLRRATAAAILAANYVAARLEDAFPVLYRGDTGLVAHECILDLRQLTAASGVTAEDVAKRLIDYGFHAPTLAFPVAGTLMVEPTESEDLAELDRFIEAMLAIRAEIDEVADGAVALADSALRNAPHTVQAVVDDEWDRAYSREQAAFPVPGLRVDKYFPPVGRIDGAGGDRNLVCACPPPEAFASEQ